jgi:hypothetical protein
VVLCRCLIKGYPMCCWNPAALLEQNHNTVQMDHYLQPAAVETRPAASAMLSNLRSISLRNVVWAIAQQTVTTLEVLHGPAHC